jgi:hypothetical protein
MFQEILVKLYSIQLLEIQFSSSQIVSCRDAIMLKKSSKFSIVVWSSGLWCHLVCRWLHSPSLKEQKKDKSWLDFPLPLASLKGPSLSAVCRASYCLYQWSLKGLFCNYRFQCLLLIHFLSTCQTMWCHNMYIKMFHEKFPQMVMIYFRTEFHILMSIDS